MISGTVTIRATTKGHLGSSLAAAAAGSSEFNHGMIIDGRRHYEAVPFFGVRVVPDKVAMRGIVRYQDRIALVPDIWTMRDFLEAQLGARYDWPGALGLPLRHSASWQDPARWWCWELIIAALGAGGLWLLDPALASSGTPNHVFKSGLPAGPIVHRNNP